MADSISVAIESSQVQPSVCPTFSHRAVLYFHHFVRGLNLEGVLRTLLSEGPS